MGLREHMLRYSHPSAAAEAAKELGLKAEDLFPLTYRQAVPVEGEVNVREGECRYAKGGV